jgi:3'(2'), 5'-bisphosphate nucleotidase
MLYEAELATARAAAAAASTVIATAYAEFQAIPDAPMDISTHADRAAQDTILNHLFAAYPDDAFCAEENTATLASLKRHGGRIWIVDPIDGSRGFARKNGEFSVMIALVDAGQVVVGVVTEPAHDRSTWASVGSGCYCATGASEPQRVQVRPTVDLSTAILTQSHSKGPPAQSPMARKLRPAQIIETYSAGVKLALVARGVVDMYVCDYTGMHDWDIAAGCLLVTEAGGQVSELSGAAIRYNQPSHWQHGGMLASNGRLHPQIVEHLRTGL